MKDGGRVLTWANALTSLRLLLCLPVYLLIEQQRWLPCVLCLFVAVLTDVFDGKMARKLHQASPMGGFFDHATDALFVTFGCLALASIDIINPWLAWLIPIAFIQYSVDSRLLARLRLAAQRCIGAHKRHRLLRADLYSGRQPAFGLVVVANLCQLVRLVVGR